MPLGVDIVNSFKSLSNFEKNELIKSGNVGEGTNKHQMIFFKLLLQFYVTANRRYCNRNVPHEVQ